MALKIKKISEEEGLKKYLVKGTTAKFLNGIRRGIMLHVPSLAVEDVSVYENNSVMFDEFLAHRLGMLPLKTDFKTYKQGDKGKLVLEKEGPCTVYSKDIKSTDPKIEVTDKKIPLVKLGKDQKVKIEMQAEMESGKEHTKWQPAIVSYHEVPVIECSKECTQCKECIEACPKNILEIKAKKVVLKKPLECTLCAACRDACKKDALKLGVEEGSFIMEVEPTTGATSQEIVEKAVDELKGMGKEFLKGLKKEKGL